MPQTVWIARHANRLDFVNPEWFNTAPLPYDPPLSLDGLQQAERLGKRLKNESIEHIFASPFLRTIQTANFVAESLDLTIKVEAGVGEWLNPEWMKEPPKLHQPQLLREEYPRLDLDYRSKVLSQYPETDRQVRERTAQTIKTLVTEYSENILLIGHGASVAGAVLALIEGEGTLKVPLCSLFKIVRKSDKWHLELNADTRHLDDPEVMVRYN
jgi:broad specificity phosphatase PhoE